MKRLTLESNARKHFLIPGRPPGETVSFAWNLYEDTSNKLKNLDFHGEIGDYFMTKSIDVQALKFYFYLFDSKGVSRHFFDY